MSSKRQDAGQSYPEWPKGLGDPLLHVRLLDNGALPRNRQEAIARFRSDNGYERKEVPPLPRQRPQLSQYENKTFPSVRIHALSRQALLILMLH